MREPSGRKSKPFTGTITCFVGTGTGEGCIDDVFRINTGLEVSFDNTQ